MFNQLSEFYKAYSDWIDSGAPEGEPFSRRGGLCGSIFLYAAMNGYPVSERSALLLVMRVQFIKAGLDRNYPFNNKDNPYDEETINGLIHTNNERVTWVKKEWQHYV